MSNPKIRVGADVGDVTGGIQRVGQAASEANRQATATLARARRELQGYTGDVEKARRAFEALQRSGARGTRNLRNQSFEEYTGGGWRNASLNDAEAQRMHRAVLARVGLTAPGGGGQTAMGFGGHSLFTAGRSVLQSAFPVGGPGGAIMRGGYEAARASSGGVASGGGMARLGMGALIGGGAFAAIKGIQSIAGKVGQAEDESSNYADLVRQLGAGAKDFGELRASVRRATGSMGLTANEAARLGVEYAHEAGMGPSTRGSLAADVGSSTGFSRGLGLDPEAGARFFGSMRHQGVTSDTKGQDRLALKIGEAVATKGEFSRVSEYLDQLNQYVSTATSSSRTSANLDGFINASSRLGALGLPGLGLAESAGLAERLDAGFRGGSGGEASDNVLLSMLQRRSGGVANAYDLAAVRAGGMYGEGSKIFGPESTQYMAAKANGDKAEMARLSKMAKSFSGKTMGDFFVGDVLGHYKGNTQAAISALGNSLGASAPDSAAFMASYLKGNGKSAPFDPNGASRDLSEGDKTRMAIADLGRVFQTWASNMLPLLTGIRDATVKVAEFFKVMEPGTLDRMKAAEAGRTGDTTGSWGGTSFRHPKYNGLDAITEGKLNLPPGLLSSIRLNGERSDSDAVSKDGARTVYQIIQATRDAFLKRTGVDAYASDENASYVAGLTLKESLNRNRGNVEEAVREYHAGTDRRNRGPINDAYAKRVLGGLGSNKLAGAGLGLEWPVEQGMGALDTPVPVDRNPNYQHEGRNHSVSISLYDRDGKPAADKTVIPLATAPRAAGAAR